MNYPFAKLVLHGCKYFGKAFIGCWLVYGGGCLMHIDYIVKMIRNVQIGSLMLVELL